MSVCVGGAASESAAFSAAPRSARDIARRQRQGVNDPGIAPVEPPRCRPRGRSRPAVSVAWSRACGAEWRRRSAFDPARKCAAHCDVHYAVDPMVVLRCTRKLLVRLKRTEVSAGVASTTRLGDWYGNILRIGRRQHLIFISEHSRLPVVIPIREAKHLEAVFPDAVRRARRRRCRL